MSRPAIPRPLRRRVRDRAAHRCEYCHMPRHLAAFAFQVDHVIAVQHGGKATAEKLAYCCAVCNRHKGPNLASIDPITRRIARLFNPRRDVWWQHLQWNGAELIGRTPRDRATIALLRINAPAAAAARYNLMTSGLF